MSDAAQNAVIRTVSLGRRFGATWALAHVSIDVRAGEVVMLTGHNGSGKTTLLKLLAGLDMPNMGDVFIQGASIHHAREQVRASTVLVSHASGHYDDLQARENLRIHARLYQREERDIDAALEAVGLAPHADRLVREFSAGMKKRLALARARLKSSAVVLLDEPFSELDPQGMATVEQWIRDERARQRTLIISTHWHEHGRKFADRELNLSAGRVHEDKKIGSVS